MSLDARVDRLTSGLSARERAWMVIQAVWDDRKPDPSILATMPPEQGREYNRLLGVARGLQMVLLPHALVLQGEVEALELRHLVLTVIAAWGSERELLRTGSALAAHVPIRQSEYDRLRAELREDYLPFDQAVETVALEQDVGQRTAARTLRAAIAEGAVRERGGGNRREVEVGSLYDWLGAENHPVPEWGWRFETVPDDEFEQHEWRSRAIGQSLAADERRGPGPAFRVLSAVGNEYAAADADLSDFDRSTRALAEQVRSDIGTLWSQLLAAEGVLREVVERSGDDLPIPDDLTALQSNIRQSLEDLFESAPGLVGDLSAPDVDQHTLAQLRDRIGAVGFA